MTQETLQSVTRYVRWLFGAGIVVVLGLTALSFWRESKSVPVGEVMIAAPLTVAEAQQKVWFSVPQLAPRAGWQEDGVHLVGDNWVVTRYAAEHGSLEVGKGTKRPMLSQSKPYPREARKTTTVNGNLAIFIQGSWDDDDQWNASLDTALLEWSSNGFHYRLQHTGLGLDYQQMIDFGASLLVKPEQAAANAVNAVAPAANPS